MLGLGFRVLAHFFSSFQIISYSKGHPRPLQLLSYALEISLSSVLVQGLNPQLRVHVNCVHANCFDPWKIFVICAMSVFAALTPYIEKTGTNCGLAHSKKKKRGGGGGGGGGGGRNQNLNRRIYLFIFAACI